MSTRTRLTAIAHELAHVQAKSGACAHGDEAVQRMFGDVGVALDLAIEALA